MTPVFIDLETFWDTDHSLSKMSPIEYCMHARTQIISMAIRVGSAPTDVFFGEKEIRRHIAALDWRDKWVIGHNLSGFDSMILAWRLGIKPKLWGCTLAMARPIHAKTTGLSLAKLVAHYGLGVKDNTALLNTKGKRLEDFTQDELDAMADYNRADTDQCAALFYKLLPHFSREELWHLDCNIRMLVEPKFKVDTGLLETALSVERSNKHKALMELAGLLRRETAAAGDHTDHDGFWSDDVGVLEFVRAEMASAPRFAKLLTEQGVEVPMKPSPTNPENQVPALAKTDEAFIEMQDHENPIVAAAARARLAVKSTILETRIEAFLDAAKHTGGFLPVPIKFCGADTTGRDSGEQYNPQNLPRITPGHPKVSDALRRSLTAPPGYLIGVADQSGIELRVNHTLWKVPSTMALYAQNAQADLYRDFAAFYYDKSEDQISKVERQFAKVCQLGLGFGAGWKTFMRIAKLMGGITLSEAEAQNAVNGWRNRYVDIKDGWAACGQALRDIMRGVERDVDPWGMVTTCAEGLRLPSGRLIRYPGLRVEDDGSTWDDGRPKKSIVYAEGRHKAYLSGPKTDENIVQALARDTVFDAALRFYKLSKLRPIMRVHDELIYMFPESEAQALLDALQGELRKPPHWWPELVVWSEGDVARSYGDAK